MSQIQIPKIICANAICENPLSEYEINRMTHRWNRFRLCHTCRRGYRRLNITAVKCAECGGLFDNHDTALYCKDCQKKRINKRHLEKYHRNKKIIEREKIVDAVFNILKEHDFVTAINIGKILDITTNSVRTHIYNLRNYHGCIIEAKYGLGYRLK
jgi:biotin operon repressor